MSLLGTSVLVRKSSKAIGPTTFRILGSAICLSLPRAPLHPLQPMTLFRYMRRSDDATGSNGKTHQISVEDRRGSHVKTRSANGVAGSSWSSVAEESTGQSTTSE